MPKLPRRGFLIDPVTGEYLWAWEHNTSESFEALPPLRIENPVTGASKMMAHPDGIILDAEDLADSGDTHLLYHQAQGTTRFVKNSDGKWAVKQKLHLWDEDGQTWEEEEIDHPMLPVIEARQRMRRRMQTRRDAKK